MKTFIENHLLNLDLHGVRHADVKDIVEDFVLTNQDEIPLIVICGNSAKMIEIVSSTLTSFPTTSDSLTVVDFCKEIKKVTRNDFYT